jgi:hypothetical protein
VADIAHHSYGKREAEGGSMAEAAFDSDLAAKGFHQAADEREAEAGALVRGS